MSDRPRPRPFRPVWLVIALLLALTLGGGAFVLNSVKGEGEGDPYHRAHAAVCTARQSAARGDRIGARDRFFAEAHQQLHELAATTARTDRPAAARLLEAKEAVETALEHASPTIPQDLGRLADTMRAALTATGREAPAPCGEG